MQILAMLLKLAALDPQISEKYHSFFISDQR
jgi:hypothetical protein